MGAMHFGLDSYLSLEPSSLCPPVYMQNDNSELIIRSKQKHKEAFGLMTFIPGISGDGSFETNGRRAASRNGNRFGKSTINFLQILKNLQ